MNLEKIISKNKTNFKALALTTVILLTSNVISYYVEKSKLDFYNCTLTNNKLIDYNTQPIIHKFFKYGAKIAVEQRFDKFDCENKLFKIEN